MRWCPHWLADGGAEGHDGTLFSIVIDAVDVSKIACRDECSVRASRADPARRAVTDRMATCTWIWGAES